MSDKIEETSRNEDKPYKVEVTKNTKGYNWVVRVYGDEIETVKADIENLEGWAKKTYGEETTP